MTKLNQVLIIGGLIRFLIPTLLPQVVPILSSINEISTPINSFKSLQEAFYYFANGIELYDGGINHHPPVLVILLSFVNDLGYPVLSNIIFNLIYTLCDIYITYRLIALNQWYHDQWSSKSGSNKYNDDLIASFYLFNPLIIVTNLSHSTLVFSVLFIIETLHQLLVIKNLPRSMIALSIASYLSYTPVWLVIPLLALMQVTNPDVPKVEIYGRNFGFFLMGLMLFIIMSFLITASWQFFYQCYGTIFLFNKIQPNIGLWWYIFTEMFEFFTPFYIGVFNLYSIIFIFPITLRFTNDGVFAFILSLIWLSFTKSYPTIGDLGYILSILPIFKSSFLNYCKFSIVYIILLIICLILSPIFYYCWIVLGNGNSNFFYSINLIWGVIYLFIMMDLIWAKLTLDYIMDNDIKDKEQIDKLRLTQL
ncbi:GPI transamidase subunit PIG-U [Scheffersomyces coipomensis]|uniref:GPI transamidase subunit PIG-U n=1 Tax=Scheffersomyces coipomensis TaxID=1788519 RepID=UPI00315D25CC